MGQKNGAPKSPIGEIDTFNPKYDDFIVEPSHSLSIKVYIPLLLHSIAKQRMLIPNVIIELIISYYSLSSTCKMYKPEKVWKQWSNE